MRIAGFYLLIWLCAAGCAAKHRAKKHNPRIAVKAAFAPLTEEQQTAKEHFLHCVSLAKSKLTKPDLLKVARFLQEGLVLARAAPDGIIPLEPTPNGPHYYLVLSLPENIGVYPEWEKLRTMPYLEAVYCRDIRTLFLKDLTRLTDAWSGTLLIHEGTHMLEKSRMPDVVAERFAYTNQVRAAKMIGGEAYIEALAIESKRVASSIIIDKVSINFAPPGEYVTQLDAAFGEAKSDHERGFRQYVLRLDATFLFLESKFHQNITLQEHFKNQLFSNEVAKIAKAVK